MITFVDAINLIGTWLDPLDFYQFRVIYVFADQTAYWQAHGGLPTLAYAARRASPALVREITENTTPANDAVEYAASIAHGNILVLDLLWRYYRRAWPDPAASRQLIDVFISGGDHAAFARYADPAAVDMDTLYEHSRWSMIAWMAARVPIVAARWIFGARGKPPPDPAIILAASLELPQRLTLPTLRVLDSAARASADRLWSGEALQSNEYIDTVDALWRWSARVGCSYPNEPSRYRSSALRNEHAEYLEYLAVRGLPVESSMIVEADSFAKQRVVWMATVEQNFDRIVLLIAILVLAAVTNIVYRAATRPTVGHYKKSSGWTVSVV